MNSTNSVALETYINSTEDAIDKFINRFKNQYLCERNVGDDNDFSSKDLEKFLLDEFVNDCNLLSNYDNFTATNTKKYFTDYIINKVNSIKKSK
jgi:hypothetical protein